MKTLFLFLLIATVAIAQNSTEQKTGDFTEIKVYDRMMVSLVKSDENKVILSGPDADYIEILNQEGILKIRMQINKIFDGSKTFVEVHYKDLQILDGNEGSEIFSSQTIEQDEITIKTQEGATVKVDLKVNFAQIKAVTAGIIRLSGEAVEQQVEINTGGFYMGKDLETSITVARIQAGGEAEIFARKTADITIRAGGKAEVYGHPTELIQNTFLGGRITVID